jgi:hypothetical protein
MYVVVPTDKALKIAFVCKSNYIHCLIKELCIDNSLGNPTYTPMTTQGSYMLKARASMMNEHVYFFYELRPKDKSRNPD